MLSLCLPYSEIRVDFRRAYNCEIMLTKIKIPLPDILNTVLALDATALDIDQVENLIKLCPTKEEMETLMEQQDDSNALLMQDAASKIPFKNFAEEVQAVSKGLKMVEQELTTLENDGAIFAGFQ
ncbi:formin-like protein 14 [Tanacetum coccineum]